MSTQTLDIPLRVFLRALAVVLLVVFLFLIRDILALLLFSIVLASGIAPIIAWLERRRVPRIVGLLSVVLLALGVFSVLLFSIVPSLADEITSFAKNFSSYAQLLVRELRPIGIAPGSPIAEGVKQAFSEFSTLLREGAQSLPALVFIFFGGIVSTVTVLLVTFYLALERDGVEKFLRLFVPNAEESYAISLWRRAQRQIGSWALGQFLLMGLIGVTTYLGLTLLGVNYALLLAFLAALFEVVPVVGPIVAGGAAVAVATFQSGQIALFVALFYVAVQQVEAHLIVPLLYRRILRLNPVIVIFALLVGAKVLGIIGIIVAVPLAAVVTEFLRDYSRGKVRF